jgi:hypothetical protein
MGSVHERLRKAGIRIDARELVPEIRTECARLAGILQHRHLRVVGLAPAADNVAVPAVALQLGASLAEVTGSPVGVVDAHGSWPGARELSNDRRRDDSLFSASWIVDNLALLTPRSFDTATMLPKLNSALHAEAQVFHHLLVDMTGFDHLGEHLAAMDLVDGVIVVARTVRTRLDDLARWMRDIPAERNLGVLLVGG